MPKFVTHEAIAANLLNLNHCSAAGVTLPWQHHLTNNEKLLGLLVMRMGKGLDINCPKKSESLGSCAVGSSSELYHCTCGI